MTLLSARFRFPERAGLAGPLRAFRRDEDGGIIIFSLYIFVLMLMIAGLAVDLMRVETVRTRLQGTLDRAVLAAADLDQTLPAKDVVEDYFEKAGVANYLNDVQVSEGLNYRTVSADASATIGMMFSNIPAAFDARGEYHGRKLGEMPPITIPASSTAEERVAKVEISLVVDISGSMASNSASGNTKIFELRQAAKDFVSTVLDPDNKDRVSVNLIPYSEHVNAGEDLFDRFNVNQRHSYSYCIEFPDNEFDDTNLDRGLYYQQMQHFQWNYNGWQNDRDDTVCPRNWYEEITTYSQRINTLHNQINALQPRAGTSIFLGLKWGVGMLDPDFDDVLDWFVTQGKVDNVFGDRPADWDDEETLKTIVLMTDGKNDRSNRIQSWAYNSNSEYAHWNNYNLWYYLNNYVFSGYHWQFHEQKYDADLGDELTYDMCDAAKAKGIVIWTIGFEVDQHGADVMEYCASSPSHFFEVEGQEIEDAFRTIARQINNLRLTY